MKLAFSASGPPESISYRNLRSIWLVEAVLYSNLQGLVALARPKSAPKVLFPPPPPATAAADFDRSSKNMTSQSHGTTTDDPPYHRHGRGEFRPTRGAKTGRCTCCGGRRPKLHPLELPVAVQRGGRVTPRGPKMIARAGSCKPQAVKTHRPQALNICIYIYTHTHTHTRARARRWAAKAGRRPFHGSGIWRTAEQAASSSNG